MPSRNFLSLGRIGLNYTSRRFSSILRSLSSTSPVLVSAEKDVYTNLAIEHWLYTNLRFGSTDPELGANQASAHKLAHYFNSPVIFIWTDEPCVVIGRHQNPWIEANLGILNRAGLKIARRHSGGGCVYHDENNINISIIGHRNDFENRQNNLKFLARVLQEEYGIECEPTKRNDLIHSSSGLKLSGSAAKLGKHNCYHHFTLLVDTDKNSLYTAIRDKQQDFVETNSSKSYRTKVVNLKELKPELEVDQVINDLASAYAKHYGAKEVPIEQDKKSQLNDQRSRAISDQAEFDDLKKFKQELESWNWTYGMTPKFKLTKCQNMLIAGIEKQLRLVVSVNKGLFESIQVEGERLPGCGNEDPSEYFRFLNGTPFTYREAMINLTRLFKVEDDGHNSMGQLGAKQVYATFMLQLIQDSNF